jgi:3-isopropylmalate dehydrogenase
VTYKLALLPGDGTGPEVMSIAKNILDSITERTSVKFELVEYQCGGGYYKEKGSIMEEGAFEFCRDEASAILLGAVATPDVAPNSKGTAGSSAIFKLRFGLDLYANVRPAKLYTGVKHKISNELLNIWNPSNVNFVIVRENTEGLYTPVRGVLNRMGKDELAVDTRIITQKGTERIVDFAFRTAQNRSGAPGDGIRRVTCVDKSNVLTGCQVFRKIYDSVSERYNEIEKDYALVDAFAQWLIRSPEKFDVAVCSNMFGDILSDLAAVIQGGMGMAPSANIGHGHALFEPVHGSSPKHAGKDIMNPSAMILSVKMMLDWLAEIKMDKECKDLASKLELAVERTIQDGKKLTSDLGGTASCSEMGTEIQSEFETMLD